MSIENNSNYTPSTKGIEEHSEAQFLRAQKERIDREYQALSMKGQALMRKLQFTLATLKSEVEELIRVRPRAWSLFQGPISTDDQNNFEDLRCDSLYDYYDHWLSRRKNSRDIVGDRLRCIERLKKKVLARQKALEDDASQLFQNPDDIAEEKDLVVGFGDDKKPRQMLEELFSDEVQLGKNCERFLKGKVPHIAQRRIQTYIDLLKELDTIHQQFSLLCNQIDPLYNELVTEMSQLFMPNKTCKISKVKSNQGENLLHLTVQEEKPDITNYICEIEPSFVFSSDQSGQSPLQIALTGTHIRLQRIVFDAAIKAINTDLEHIPDDYPLVQQIGELIYALREILHGYGNDLLKRKWWWSELKQNWPKLGTTLWFISYPFRTKDLNPRQEALIELLQCLHEVVKELKLEEFIEKEAMLSDQSPRGLFRRSALFDKLEQRLKDVGVMEHPDFNDQRNTYLVRRAEEEAKAWRNKFEELQKLAAKKQQEFEEYKRTHESNHDNEEKQQSSNSSHRFF